MTDAAPLADSSTSRTYATTATKGTITTTIIIIPALVNAVCKMQGLPRLRQYEDTPKHKRVLCNEVGDLTPIEPEPDDTDTRPQVERDPPLQVYCDYEAMTDAVGESDPHTSLR